MESRIMEDSFSHSKRNFEHRIRKNENEVDKLGRTKNFEKT